MKFLKKIVVSVLIFESKLIIKKYKPFIVAVTGSVGKTSAKDAIYCMLKGHFLYARKSEKSMNSEIGLPITIIGVPNAWRSLTSWLKNIFAGLRLIVKRCEYPDCLVLEIGADHPNDIKSITRWIHPDISVIGRISKTPVHVEFFTSPEQVFEEKAALATGVKPSGVLVLFGDDDDIVALGDTAKLKNVRVITYGFGDKSQVRGSNYTISYIRDDQQGYSRPNGISFDISTNGQTIPAHLEGVLGGSYMYPLLAACAVGVAKGLDRDQISRGLNSYKAPRGRMNLVRGLNGSTIIDDTYNSSPDAVVSALQSLAGIETTGSKVAILGDMMELGKYSAEEHRKIGKVVSGVVDTLVTVGQRSKLTVEGAVEAGFSRVKAISFDNSLEVLGKLSSGIKSGDIILVKGSQSIRMERVVKDLMENPGEAESLLVRQEKEWLEKE